MDIIKRLENYKYLSIQIQSRIDSINETEKTCALCGNSKRVRKSADEINKWQLKKIDELKAERKELEALIDSVADPLLSEALQLRYIESLSLDKVAEEMNYSSEWIKMRIMPNALKAIQSLTAEK